MIKQLKAFNKNLIKPDELIYVVYTSYQGSYISEFTLSSGVLVCDISNRPYVKCFETGRYFNGILYYDYDINEIALFVDKLNIPGLNNKESPCIVFDNLNDAQMREQIWNKSETLPSMLKSVEGITKIPFELK